jgi:hypothetical protein
MKDDDSKIYRVLAQDPDRMGFIGKVLWLIIVWLEWHRQRLKKQIEEMDAEDEETS